MNKKEIVDLLTGSSISDEELFSYARSIRQSSSGNSVLLRAAVEMTNKCRVNCTFCPMRRANADIESLYMLDQDSLVHAASTIRDSGLDVILVQGGEIPQTTAVLEGAIPKMLEAFAGRVEILLNIGNKTREEYLRLRKAGAISCILKHETSDQELYRKLKGEDLRERLRCLSTLIELGFKVGTGTIVGLPGQTLETIADDILLAREFGVHMVSASPFIPARLTPLSECAPGSIAVTLRTIAAMRLALPNSLIPSVSALEIYRNGAQSTGIAAGANVMTVNFTPDTARANYLIYGSNRFIVTLEHAKNVARMNGLRTAGSRWL